jgi:hypothetical protein
MKTIFKYMLNPGYQVLELPGDEIVILSVGVQHGQIVLWAMIDTESPKHEIGVQVVGTGWKLSGLEDWHFIGTVQVDNLVWHIFTGEKG